METGAARSADGVSIRFETAGSGEPALVFVHGWSCDRGYWRHQVRPFATRRRVVAVDLAGHGDSGTGRTEWTMQAFGDDVVAVVDALGLARIVLIGHSMGGDVVIETAHRLGQRVVGIVWVDVYRSLGSPRTTAQIDEFLEPLRTDFAAATRIVVRKMFTERSDPHLVEAIAADMAAAPPDIAIDALAHSFANDRPILERLVEVHAPMVAINPDAPPTDVESLARFRIRTIAMPGVGHFPMLEDPARFNAILEGALEAMAPR